HVEMPAEARERQQEVAELVLDGRPVTGGDRGFELALLLADLIEDARGRVPVETQVHRLLAELMGPDEGRKRLRHARERVVALAGGTPLFRLDLAPVAHDLVGATDL